MTVITFILALISVVLIISVLKSKGTQRKILLVITTIFFLIPIILIFLVKPAQQGKIFPQYGKLSLLFYEPKDLWKPLAAANLERNKKVYTFNLSHKYVGNYTIQILFSDQRRNILEIDKRDFSITVIFYDQGKILFSKASSNVGIFKGLNGSGLIYLRYSIPEDLPINKKVRTKIVMTGNIDDFINKYGDGKIVIKKGSDL